MSEHEARFIAEAFLSWAYWWAVASIVFVSLWLWFDD